MLILLSYLFIISSFFENLRNKLIVWIFTNNSPHYNCKCQNLPTTICKVIINYWVVVLLGVHFTTPLKPATPFTGRSPRSVNLNNNFLPPSNSFKTCNSFHGPKASQCQHKQQSPTVLQLLPQKYRTKNTVKLTTLPDKGILKKKENKSKVKMQFVFV